MKMIRVLLLVGLVWSLFAITLQAQDLAEKKAQAKAYFLSGNYSAALSVLQTIRQNRQEDQESRFLFGATLYHVNRLDEAEKILTALLKEKQASAEALLYMGRIYHDQHAFSEASDYYKAYLKTLPVNHPNRVFVRDAIRRCANGLQLQFRQALALVENLGPEINSSGDEFGPVMSPNYGDRLYFSAARPGSIGGARDRYGRPDELYGHYSSDILVAQFSQGQWGRTQPLNYLLNSPKHEVLFDFSANGQVLFYFQGSSYSNGQLLQDTFRLTNRVLSSDPFVSPADAIAGITAPQVFQDTLLLFASNRPGGYGGYDLYRAVLRQGRWTSPENLGPQINSTYDEVTPFLALDGKTLYFSTNNPEKSLGGFDVLKVQFNPETKQYTTAYNLGLPINSAADDTHFRLARDGYTAYFCSARKDGLGERDLYAAYFFDYLTEMSITFLQNRNPAPGFYSRAESSTATYYEFPGILFDQNAELFQGGNQEQLANITRLLKATPELSLIITGYSRQGNTPAARLSEGLQQAENLGQYFLDLGIGANRLSLRGAEPGTLSAALQAVSFHFYYSRAVPFALNTPVPFAGETGAVNRDGLCFKIRLQAGKTPYGGPVPPNARELLVEKNPAEKVYFYSLGIFNTYTAAREQARLWSGSTRLEVIPYLRGYQLTREEAFRWQKDYPELASYLADR